MPSNWMRIAIGLLAGVFTVVGVVSSADRSEFLRIAPAQIHWEDIPNGLGAQQAILMGDPEKPGLYVMRAKFPPHVMDRPHLHSKARYVTVLEGLWITGTGERFDLAQTVALKPGGFMFHPANGVHWDGSSGAEPVVVQIMGEGPVTTTPVDSTKPFWVEVPH